MAEGGKGRRLAGRRLLSLLSLAGTTAAVWSGTSGFHGSTAADAPVDRPSSNAPIGPAGSTWLAAHGTPAGRSAPVADLAIVASSPGVTADTTQAPAAPAAPASTVPATATTVVAESTTTAPPLPYHEAVGRDALARIAYPWQQELEGWTIQFLPGRAGLLGGTWTYEKRVEIYVRDGQTVDEVAFTLAHELGHAVDVTHFDEVQRQKWRSVRAIPADTPWWVESGATDFSSGSGDWAEAFAVWQVGGASQSRLGGQPTAAELAVVAQLST